MVSFFRVLLFLWSCACMCGHLYCAWQYFWRHHGRTLRLGSTVLHEKEVTMSHPSCGWYSAMAGLWANGADCDISSWFRINNTFNMKNACLYKYTKTKSIYFHFGIPSQRLTTTSKCSVIFLVFTITVTRWREGLSRRKHHHDSLSAEELTGSNHFLVLIWFLLFNSHWSICHWEMSGAFVDESHWKFGWGAGHQSKNEGVDLTHHPEFTTSEPVLSDLRNVTGDLLSDMTRSVRHLPGLGQVRHLPRCLFLNGLRSWCTLMLHEKLTRVRSRTYIRIHK